MTNVLHPGKALAEELAKRGWTQSDLTFILGGNPKAVNQIVNGKQGVSPSMSKALGHALGLPEAHFIGLQRAYDLATANEPEAGVLARATMLKTYPVREMVRRGWLRSTGAESLGPQLARFFEASETNEIPYLAHAARKTGYEEREVAPAQLAWLFRVRQIAKTMVVRPYSQRGLADAVVRMRDLLIEPDEARHVPKLLAECGVRFLIVEALPQSKIDGVCFWLDARSPVIGISTRFDRIDNFWFVLRHECEHVLQGHGRGKPEGIIGTDVGGTINVSDEEEVSNTAAADFCVPQDKMRSFIARKNPFFYEKDVLGFSKLNGVHPSLPVGQIQHHTGRFDYLRKYQVKIRQHVLPGAIVDGWDRPFNLD